MSNLVHNERLKLRATFLSNLGIAAFIACFITPGFFAFAETRIERFIMALIPAHALPRAIAMILPFVTRCTILKVPARCRQRRNEGGENCGLAIADGLTSASNAPCPILKSSFQAPNKTPTLR